jgi:membrane dipeptidase
LHDHTAVRPHDPGQIVDARREIRDPTGYEGLAVSRLDVVFEAFMDGTNPITSQAGWKWNDIVFDLGMRYSDIAHQEFVYVALTVPEVEAAKPTGRIALIPSIESATPIENELDRVDILYGLGVRCLGLTYNEANQLGSGLAEEADAGLSGFGRRAVRRMNKIGMTIDLAHAGDRTSLEAIQASDRPVVISHAGARSLWPTRRMKSDEVIRALATRGGVIGIEAAPHTTLSQSHPEHSVESVMEHVAYCIDLVGIDHVALGPDTNFGDHVAHHKIFASQLSIQSTHESPLEFPQVEYVRGFENPSECLRNAVRWLVKHRYSDDDIAKVMGGNVLRVIRETWYR